jgi:hypothetical protein
VQSTAGHIKPRHHCSQQTSLCLSLRGRVGNPNHHLWNNHGTWYVHYTVCEPGRTGFRRRESLRTHDVAEARRRRDRLFRMLKGGVQ